ncbi:biliverdin-producing heme oxygenase [Serinibacter arcticus]|uniref:Biliverdin-producing heme oxygenase n=2 Tax=Serinibacter arcticus TaxID=1655435 RepID=A0A2U1ZVC7_9MICO|nr:biliverdin-producing heme oxygenase [Serinibacter arcticus]
MIVETLAPDTALSSLLRTATRPQHEHAETRGFVTQLMGGALSREAYIDLATQHHAIYSALEAAGERLRGDAAAAPFLIDALVRVPSLEADLALLLGPDWRDAVDVLPATRAYIEVLDGIDTAERFVAHHYTRYLGDLSGGQIISRMLQRHYGMTPEELTFYTFTEIPKPKPFKDDYRALLDAAPFTPEQIDAVVEEAKVAFDLNAALFVDLGGRNDEDSTAA